MSINGTPAYDMDAGLTAELYVSSMPQGELDSAVMETHGLQGQLEANGIRTRIQGHRTCIAVYVAPEALERARVIRDKFFK